MNEKLRIISLYRTALGESWKVFSDRIAEETGLSWSAVYKIVTGRSVKIHSRSEVKILAWFDLNRDKIEREISDQVRSA